ncbi:MAG: hypothetical protein DRP59_02305 [Spirochaetes bacterium]|nr:MAG: hypothetical protein DRP59_02305 [Spirochaetota bacterium]
MNKKLNTVLFLLAASIYNIIAMIVIIVLLLFIVSRFITEQATPGIASGIFIFIFILGIAGSFFIYHRTIKYLSRKIDFDKYFMPLIRSRKK